MEQPCFLRCCFNVRVYRSYFLSILHQSFSYTLWVGGGGDQCAAELVPRSASCWDSISARGPAGAQSDAALPGFQRSCLPLPNTKGQGSFSLVTPTSSVAQPGFTTLLVPYKNSRVFLFSRAGGGGAVAPVPSRYTYIV